MATDRGTVSQLHGTLPESLHQHIVPLKPIMAPLMTHLWITFAQSLNELDNMANPAYSYEKQHYLPTDARELLIQEILKCVVNYLNQHTSDRDDGGNFALNHYINEPQKEGPWVPRLAAQKDSYEDNMGALIHKNTLDQAAKNLEYWGNEIESFDHERIESMHGMITQRRSDLLGLKRGLVPKALSTTGVIDKNLHVDTAKPRGCSSVTDAPASKARRGTPHQRTANNTKALSTTAARAPTNKIAKSSRPKRMHKCPDCDTEFQFEARLKSHQAVHIKGQHPCPECGSAFGRDSSLKRHLSTPGACQKKKEAKRRTASFQNSTAGTRPSSHHNFPYENAERSTSSLIDSGSVQSSPLDVRIPTQTTFDQQFWNFELQPNTSSNNVHYEPGYQSNIGSHQRPNDILADWSNYEEYNVS